MLLPVYGCARTTGLEASACFPVWTIRPHSVPGLLAWAARVDRALMNFFVSSRSRSLLLGVTFLLCLPVIAYGAIAHKSTKGLDRHLRVEHHPPRARHADRPSGTRKTRHNGDAHKARAKRTNAKKGRKPSPKSGKRAITPTPIVAPITTSESGTTTSPGPTATTTSSAPTTPPGSTTTPTSTTTTSTSTTTTSTSTTTLSQDVPYADGRPAGLE